MIVRKHAKQQASARKVDNKLGFSNVAEGDRLPRKLICENKMSESYLSASPSTIRERLENCSKPISYEVVKRSRFNSNGARFERGACDEIHKQHAAADGDGTPVNQLVPKTVVKGFPPLV
eukprot:2685136-Prymnesium_polylepis.1